MTKARVPAARTLGKQEVVITRVFDAPRELLWEVWTDTLSHALVQKLGLVRSPPPAADICDGVNP